MQKNMNNPYTTLVKVATLAAYAALPIARPFNRATHFSMFFHASGRMSVILLF